MSSGLAFLVVGLWLLALAFVADHIVASGRREDARRASFRLHFPSETGEPAVTSVLRAFAGLGHGSPLIFRSLVFEVVSQGDRIEHYLHVPAAWVESVRAQLVSSVPDLRLELLRAAPLPPLSCARELGLTHDWHLLRIDAIPAGTSSLLAVLQPLGRDEAMVVQWMARPAGAGPVPTTGRNQPVGSWWLWFLSSIWRKSQPDLVSLGMQKAKTSEPLFGVVGRLGVQAATQDRAVHLLRRLRGGLTTVEAPGATLVARWLPTSWTVRRMAARRTPQWKASRLNARELAAVIAWPIGTPAVPGLVLARSRHFPAASLLPRAGRVLGDGTDEHGSRPVAQRLSDALTHTWMLGATGSGKSTLLANLITQDLATPERPAVVVIEPKGDLCADILARVPAERHEDVIYLDAASDVLVGLNPLRPDEPDRELVADEVYGVFRQVSASWGPRLGDVLHTALLTLVRQPDACLTELPLLLGDDAYRRRVVGGLGEDAWMLRPVWAWYDGLNPAERAAVAAPILTRVRPWIVRSRLRHLLGVARPRWSFREVLDRRRILLVVLNPGLLGRETASLLGALILQGVWQAARARGALTQAERRPALVYVDEWQEFTRLPTDLGEVLAQARGYRLGMVLANQSAAQLSPELRAAVSANARSKLAMAVDAQDAALMAREIGSGVTAADVQGLGAYQAITSLMVAGEAASPVSITTRPLTPPVASAAAVRHLSQERYGLDPDQVEAAIRARHEPEEPMGAVRRRRRS